jgi:hypothetical protein
MEDNGICEGKIEFDSFGRAGAFHGHGAALVEMPLIFDPSVSARS